MLPLVLVLTALLAFAAAWTAASARRGREDLSNPQCAACNRDVSDRAWPDVEGESLTCLCGATLDGSGQRTLLWRRTVAGIRAPRPRTRRAAIALAMSLVALLSTDTILRATGRTWWALMPDSILTAAIRRRTSGAREEVERRVRARTISATLAQDLIVASSVAGEYQTDDALAEIALSEPSLREQLLERLFQVDVAQAPSWYSPTPAPHGTVYVRIRHADTQVIPSFIRIDAVRIDGVPVRWTLEEDTNAGTPINLGRRVLTGMALLRCLPVAVPSPTGSVVEVDVTFAVGPYTPAAPFDPFIDSPVDESPSKPSAWCVPATTISRTVRTTLPSTPDPLEGEARP